jgi:hypothetical protein
MSSTTALPTSADGAAGADGAAVQAGPPDAVTPDGIMQLGMAFWGSKTLLSAVELGVFSTLAAGPLPEPELRARLGLDGRGTRDFLDALVALGMLDRQADGYHNTPETDLFLDPAKPSSYIGGFLEMANTRLYPFWGDLTEALRTGDPQNEAKEGEDLFAALYGDPELLRVFLTAMTGISVPSAIAIAQKFPWERYQSFCDVGTAQGSLPVHVALGHPHLTGTGFDLPPVGPIFTEFIESFGLQDRVRFVPGDFFTDPLPTADVIVMGHILHDWGTVDKLRLLRLASMSTRTMKIALALVPAAAVLMVVLTGCGGSNAPAEKEFYGPVQPLGAGSARTYVTVGADGQPSEVGVRMTTAAMDGLPAGLPAHRLLPDDLRRAFRRGDERVRHRPRRADDAHRELAVTRCAWQLRHGQSIHAGGKKCAGSVER